MTVRWCWWQVGALIASAIMSVACHAQTVSPTLDGRAIYHGFVPFIAGNEVTPFRMPPHLVACARCHGATGEGGREGGVVVPPLSSVALFGRRGPFGPFASPDDVVRAITSGIGRDGAALGASMPRYRLSTDEAAAILSYLARIGGADDNPPGVTPQTIRLASILPLTGPGASVGLAVRRGLDGIFADVNRSGGIHGRIIDLVVFDAAIDRETLGAGVIAHAPYAVIAGMWRTADSTIDRVLAQRRIGKIATLIPKAKASELDAWDADLLPPLDVQQSTLEKALRDCAAAGVRLGVSIVADASRDDGHGVQWFENAAALQAVQDTSRGGCIGAGLAASVGLHRNGDPNWTQQIVLPFPAALLRSPDIWGRLGQVAARLTVELLSRSGARLHEASLLDAARWRDIEAVDDAPIRFDRIRRYGWNADVIVQSAASADVNLTVNTGSN